MAAKFGTSGLRGLVEELTDGTAARFAHAFVLHLLGTRRALPGERIYIGEDMRDSSPLIADQCAAAVHAAGLVPVRCGVLPTPALASFAMAKGRAALIITGSHIPADRNGVKFYRPDGEIDKADEIALTERAAGLPAIIYPPVRANENAHQAALGFFVQRYAGALKPDALAGWRIGVYQHSSAARDVLGGILQAVGAEIVALGRSETFIPVDTEAVSDETRLLLRDWSRQFTLDAIVSADGDGDRPLLADENGECLRGDVLGLVAAMVLQADAVITPVTSNSGIEGAVGAKVIRTRVGSPFVIAGMAEASASGALRVVGFEANGGTLTGSPMRFGKATLPTLPTRDSVLPILATLAAARTRNLALSAFVNNLGLPVTSSGRIENFPTATSSALVSLLADNPEQRQAFFAPLGEVLQIDRTDGLRVMLSGGNILHLRPSGNAPEMRCYVEANDEAAAETLIARGIARILEWTEKPQPQA